MPLCGHPLSDAFFGFANSASSSAIRAASALWKKSGLENGIAHYLLLGRES